MKSQTRINRARLLDGNWFMRAEGSNYWKREWVRGENGERVLTQRPSPNNKRVRAYDKAGSVPSEVYRYPDYTAASPIVWKLPSGDYVLTGDYHPSFCDAPDDKGRTFPTGRFRKLAGERELLIQAQAKLDGMGCVQVIPMDFGSAGKDEYKHSARGLTSVGAVVKQDPVANNKSKLTKFQPFAAACENGLVYIVENTFSPETLELLYKELESFTGERSTAYLKDD